MLNRPGFEVVTSMDFSIMSLKPTSDGFSFNSEGAREFLSVKSSIKETSLCTFREPLDTDLRPPSDNSPFSPFSKEVKAVEICLSGTARSSRNMLIYVVLTSSFSLIFLANSYCLFFDFAFRSF